MDDKEIGKPKTERQKDFNEMLKEFADPDCHICNGTGRIAYGELKGSVCFCLNEYLRDPK